MTEIPASLASESSPAAPRPPLALGPETGPEPDQAPHGLVPVLLTLLLVAVALIVGPTIAELGKPGPDEFYYLSYSKTLVERGAGAFRDLFQAYAAESRLWDYPNPLRVGYLALAALWMGADGVSPQSLAHLSLVAHLLSIVVVHRLVARRLGAPRALLAAAIFAGSPLLLGMSRRALQDSVVTLAALVVVSTFLAALDRPERRWHLALFAGALGGAILVKESLVLLVPPMALWLLIERRAGRAQGALLRFTLATSAALVSAATVWVVAAGDVDTVRRVIEIVRRVPATNEYGLRFGGGPWYRYLIDFVAVSAVPTLLGVAGAALALERLRRGEGERLHLFLALLAAVTLAEYAFLPKSVRYVMLLELPLRVFAVEALWRLLPARSEAVRVATTTAVVLLLALADVRSFRELFVERGLYDPVSAPLLELRGIVPGS